MLNKVTHTRRVSSTLLARGGIVIRDLPAMVSQPLMRTKLSYDSTAIYMPGRSATRYSAAYTTLLSLVGSVLLLSLLTYFFYTAATLKSNVFLILSWTMVSLWLIAIVWSDELVKRSDKLALTFTIPSMYFVLYTLLFVYTATSTWRLIMAIPLPKFDIHSIQTAILLEAYSMRF
jgi:hypothetical protein